VRPVEDAAADFLRSHAPRVKMGKGVEGRCRIPFEIVVDSNAVAKRCLVLFVVGASAFLGIATLLTQACCAVG